LQHGQQRRAQLLGTQTIQGLRLYDHGHDCASAGNATPLAHAPIGRPHVSDQIQSTVMRPPSPRRCQGKSWARMLTIRWPARPARTSEPSVHLLVPVAPHHGDTSRVLLPEKAHLALSAKTVPVTPHLGANQSLPPNLIGEGRRTGHAGAYVCKCAIAEPIWKRRT